jgi:hypothetical protein
MQLGMTVLSVVLLVTTMVGVLGTILNRSAADRDDRERPRAERQTGDRS